MNPTTIEEIIQLVTETAPAAYTAIATILKEINNHDSEEKIVRHAEVLAAKAELGL